jgi:hypothetical protein
LKLNKVHGGKEFSAFFRFIGQVKNHKQGMGEDVKTKPIYENTRTKTNKARRVLQFDIMTSKGNKLKVELAGMEMPKAQAYSSADKKSISVDWKDRFDKKKYPNATYHLIDTPWDLTEEIGSNLKEGDWVQVKGKYEFDAFKKDDGTEVPVVKRIISSVEIIEDGQEVSFKGEKFNYVCDINSLDFKEVNYFKMEIGINSTYQDEETKDTIVNSYFMTYGKEKSSIKDVKLTVYNKETGKKSLSDAFALLNRGDFVKVEGTDNNRVEYVWTDKEVKEVDGDPFADVEEVATERELVISGSKKGLEITKVINGSLIKEALTEDEMDRGIEALLKDEIDDESLPF